MNNIYIDKYKFELFKFDGNTYSTELISDINKICNNQHIINLNSDNDIAIFIDIYPHPICKVKYYVEKIFRVNQDILKVALIRKGYYDYIGILKNQTDPNQTIEDLKKYI